MKVGFSQITKILCATFSIGIAISPCSAQVSVGGAQLANGTYATLAAAFTAINNNSNQAGNNIVIAITANTNETVVASLNAPSQPWNSFIITPVGGGARTISGAMAAGNPLINLNGADNVTIDGLNTGGNSLTFINTTASATAGTSTIRFINGATNNTITNCSVLGSSAADAGFAIPNAGGTVFFSTDANTPNGNDNNTISNCNIGPAGSNLPTKGVYSLGSTSTQQIYNSGNTITNCNIYDYFNISVASSGILIVDGNEGWTLSNNKLFQTVARTQTAASNHTAIRVDWNLSANAGYGFTIDNNTIGFNSATGTGNYVLNGGNNTRFFGIHASFTTDITKPFSSVSNNTISNITMSGALTGTLGTSPFIGIYSANGQIIMNGNTIGSLTTSGLIPNNNNIVISSNSTTSATTALEVYGIFRIGSSNQLFTTNNNSIGGISFSGNSGGRSIFAMRCSGSSGSVWECKNNIIGSDGGTSFNASSNFVSTASTVTGIHSNMPTAIISNNVIRSMSNSGGSGTGLTLLSPHAICGINVATNTEQLLVEGNIINRLIQTSISNLGSIVCGISIGSTSSNSVIKRNLVHGLSNYVNSTSASIVGIRSVSNGTNTFENNMVQVGIMFNGDGQPNSHASIIGILESAGTNNYYHNSVYVGGDNIVSTGTPAPTFAFRSIVSSGVRNIFNNIFFNARSNGAGTSNHYAVGLSSTNGINMNYNILLANGNGGVLGTNNNINLADLGSWQTSTGFDLNSMELNPEFINPTGNVNDVDLHIQASPVPTPVEGNGFLIGSILNDFDDEVRSTLSPVDIGADAGNFQGFELNECNSNFQFSVTNCNQVSFFPADLTLSYNWNFGNNEISSLVQPSHTYLSSGLFNVCLVTSGSNCQSTQHCESVTIENPNDFTLTISSNNGNIICPNGSLMLNASSGFDSYTWSNGGNGQSTNINNNGTFNATALTTSGCLITSNSITISLDNSGGVGSINIIPSQNFICDNPVLLNATNGFQNYTWSNGNLGLTNIVSSPGVYSVSAFTVNNCPASSFPFTLNSIPTIQANITYTQTSNFVALFDANAQNANSYFWDFGDGNSSTNANPTHNYPIEGTYTVSLTLINECDTLTINRQVSIIKLSIDELNSNSWSIYPNPTSGLIFIQPSLANFSNVEISIYNQLGQIVIERSEQLNNENLIPLDLSALRSGLYYIALKAKEDVPIHFQKVILNH